MNPPIENQILIAGIGNIFFGDDAFGVELVHELLRRSWPEEVQVIDFGIRSYDLAYALTQGCDATILLDAVPRGEAPGTVYLLEPELDDLPGCEPNSADAHGLGPVAVLQLARALGALPRKIYLVGCEPAVLESDNGEIGLSPSVRAALPQAIKMIESLVRDLLAAKMKTVAGAVPA